MISPVRTQRLPTRIPARIAPSRGLRMRAEPSKMDTQIKDAIKEAEEACAETGKKNECAAAWDEVEELSAAASHKKESAVNDPLEQYCGDNPDADECRVYED